jgi:L-lysine exporter family protein LysE/ArgO
VNTYVLGQGFVLAASLLVAIGAQNAFVLRQGLRREHVLAVAGACSLFDWMLMAAGIGGLGAMVRSHPGLSGWFAAAGALFLTGYGVFAWRRAWSAESLRPQDAGNRLRRRDALIQCAAFTFLNPHVYLDTVVLIGSVGAQQAPPTQSSFFLGAAAASTVWFFSLGFGARLLAPLFAKPVAWRVLDAVVGATMFALAASLAGDALRGLRAAG